MDSNEEADPSSSSSSSLSSSLSSSSLDSSLDSSSSSSSFSLKTIFCGVFIPQRNFSKPYAYYCLAMFCLINLLDQADRWALPTLQSAGLQCSSCGSADSSFYDKCKEECLNISDVDMGLLTGPTFSVTALLCTIPFGWMADRLNRVVMLWCGLIIWSLATLASAFTHEFYQLVFCRCLLGVGQAVVNPCVFSITSDLFAEDRAFFLSFFTSMIYTGQAFGLGCGALSQATSWRFAFLILGIPGLCLSVPFIFTVREPVRGLSEKKEENEEEKLKISNTEQEEQEEELTFKDKINQVLEQVWFIISYPPFSMLWIAGLLRFMAGYAIGGWIQVFYRRVHGIEPSKLALFLAFIIPSAGLLSAYTGGYISDKWHKRDPSGKAWLCVISSFLGCLFMSLLLMVPSLELSLVFLWLEYFTAEMWYAPAASIALDMNPPSMRSFATAVYLACGAFGAASSVIVGALNSIFGQEIDEGTDEEVVYDPTAALLVMTSGMYVLSGSCFIALGYLLRVYEGTTALRIEENN